MKAAFLLDEGEVETVSHYYAASFFEPDVDCILDIGGQDKGNVSRLRIIQLTLYSSMRHVPPDVVLS